MIYLILGFVLWIAWMLIKDSIQKSNSKKLIDGLDNDGLELRLPLIHLQGLDLGEGTEVLLTATKDVVTVVVGKITYTIDIEQINSISVQSIANTIADKRFSIKNATIGGVLFGNVGAAVGGFSGGDSLELKTMIINYIGKNGNPNYIVLMPRYSDVKNKMLVRSSNNMLDGIFNSINHAINKKNSDKPQIVNKL